MRSVTGSLYFWSRVLPSVVFWVQFTATIYALLKELHFAFYKWQGQQPVHMFTNQLNQLKLKYQNQ